MPAVIQFSDNIALAINNLPPSAIHNKIFGTSIHLNRAFNIIKPHPTPLNFKARNTRHHSIFNTITIPNHLMTITNGCWYTITHIIYNNIYFLCLIIASSVLPPTTLHKRMHYIAIQFKQLIRMVRNIQI